MIVYIAGKITGDPNYQKKFADVERVLKELYSEVINPAEVCANLPKSFSWRDYMEVTHELLLRADVVAYLPDWKESPGTCIELGFAAAAGKILYAITD
ncbi:DUF4406 domain-containing protein [Anaerovoracaceae bacterium 41-7]